MKFIVSPSTMGAIDYFVVEFIARIRWERISVKCAVSYGLIID